MSFLSAATSALFAVLLALSATGGSDDEVVERLHVRFAGEPLTGRSCHEAIAASAEPGEATIRFQYSITGGRRSSAQPFTGRVAFSLGEVVVTMPSSIAWPNMSAGDRERAEALRHAILHHEIGHVRIAEALRDELNAHDGVSAPDRVAFQSAADALGRDGFERFHRAEREYDALTDHGRRQHLAPGVLAGPDTLIVCR